jgi:hypothetical protein
MNENEKLAREAANRFAQDNGLNAARELLLQEAILASIVKSHEPAAQPQRSGVDPGIVAYADALLQTQNAKRLERERTTGAATSEPQGEWRETHGLIYTGDTFVGRAFDGKNGAKDLCAAHNAALAAERERVKKLADEWWDMKLAAAEKDAMQWENKAFKYKDEAERAHQQLLNREARWEESEKMRELAEQELTAERDANRGLYVESNERYQQLLTAQAAIEKADKELRELYHSYGDGTDVTQVIERVTHLFANQATALAEHDAAIVKPFATALRRMPEVAYQTIIEHAGVELENLANELQCICDAALASVKEGK